MIHMLQKMYGNGQVVRLDLGRGVIVGRLRSFITGDDQPPGVDVEMSDGAHVYVNVNHIVHARLANTPRLLMGNV